MTNDGGECVIAGFPGNERRTFAKHGAFFSKPGGSGGRSSPSLKERGFPTAFSVIDYGEEPIPPLGPEDKVWLAEWMQQHGLR